MYRPGGGVENDVLVANDGRGAAVRAADQRIAAREKLIEVEGFDEIIIGARPQADLIGLAKARGLL